MARTWDGVRKDVIDAGLVDVQDAEIARKELHDAVRAQRLADVRKGQSVTQMDLAKSMDVSQARVSKIERGDLSKTEIGTLESYVTGLGGKLRVVAFSYLAAWMLVALMILAWPTRGATSR